jgi:NADH dehydrogenase
VTTGGKHACVRNKQWSEYALRTHRRIFHAFETAELTSDASEREPWLNFGVVGAGPSGVELVGLSSSWRNHRG